MFGLFKRQNSGASQRFPRIYGLTDFGITANKTALAGQYNKIGEVTVPAQQQITFGANDPIGGGSIAGRSCYIRLDNESGVQLNGKIRFAITNANETNTIIVSEERTEKLAADQNDRMKAVLLPEFASRAREDSKLQILFYPDGSSTVTVDYDGTNTKILVPVTVYQ